MLVLLDEYVSNIQAYRAKSDEESIYHVAIMLEQEAKKQKSIYHEVIGVYHISKFHYVKGEYTKSLAKSLHGLQLCKQTDNVFYEMILNNLAGIVYGALGDQISSIEYMLKAYYIALEHPELNFTYFIENNIGVLFFNMKMYEKAYEFLLKSAATRNLTDISSIKESDGINIINMIGCSIKTNNKVIYDQWYPYLEYYLKHFHLKTVEDDYLLYKFILSCKQKDFIKIREYVDEMYIKYQENTDHLHVLKNLFDAFSYLIELQEKDLCEKLFKFMEDILKNYPDYKNQSRLDHCRVQMNMMFHEDEKLKDSLLKYYLDKCKEDEQWQNDLKKSLLNKVELEELLNEQKIILKQNEELQRNSEIEDFTKLLNKTAFQKHVIEAIKYKDEQYMALFVIDVDKFKSVNDRFGHLSGDEVLLKVVDILKQETRDIDHIGRIGGDEFCIFMKNIYSLKYVRETAESILHKVKCMNLIEKDMHVTVSIGIHVINQKESYEDIFQSADQLMYIAKNAGGNRYKMNL